MNEQLINNDQQSVSSHLKRLSCHALILTCVCVSKCLYVCMCCSCRHEAHESLQTLKPTREVSAEVSAEVLKKRSLDPQSLESEGSQGEDKKETD